MENSITAEKTNPTFSSNTNCHINNDLLRTMIDQVPSKLIFDMGNRPVQKSKDEIIELDNSKAKLAIIKSYGDNEKERVKRQKWLLIAVVFLTALQLIVFNVIIFFTVYQSFKLSTKDVIQNHEIINQVFELLKYYIGATLVELIGMIVFITKGTFTSEHIKTMELLVKR